jgi:hypothetical protein
MDHYKWWIVHNAQKLAPFLRHDFVNFKPMLHDIFFPFTNFTQSRLVLHSFSLKVRKCICIFKSKQFHKNEEKKHYEDIAIAPTTILIN